MLAVVAEGAEEGLIDGSVHELGGEGVVLKHVGKRVGLAFEPEFGFVVDFVNAPEEDRGGLVRVVDGCAGAGIVERSPNGYTWRKVPLVGVFGGSCNPKGTHTLTELSSKEVIPRLETVVICEFVADVDLVEFVVGYAIVAFDGHLVQRFLV